MNKYLYWLYVASEVYATVKDCLSFATKIGTKYEHQRNLCLFPPSGSLEFSAMEFLELFPKANSGNQFVLVITDRYSKLTRSIPTRTKTATHITTILLEKLVLLYAILYLLLNQNGPQLLGKFFWALCGYLGVKSWRRQRTTLKQTERLNGTKRKSSRGCAATFLRIISIGIHISIRSSTRIVTRCITRQASNRSSSCCLESLQTKRWPSYRRLWRQIEERKCQQKRCNKYF